jgi:dihydroorotase
MSALICVRHFDPHMHGRLGAVREVLIKEAAKRMCGGIFEPNTNPHLLIYDDVVRYVDKARQIAPDRTWSASIYLTPWTSLSEVTYAWRKGCLAHVKGYPPHGTTHSGESVPPEMLLDINSPVGKLLCGLADEGIPFKHHGEVVTWEGRPVHPQLRESQWYKEIQPRLDELYIPRGLRRIHAHITTHEAAVHACQHGDQHNCVYELTGHHLLSDWNIQYDGGNLLPDHHWLPVTKDEFHTEAIRGLVRARLPFIHAASDMAGHSTERKYAQRVFGGGYTYHCSLELYVQILEELGVLDFADDFLYFNAKCFHGSRVPNNPEPFYLQQKDWTVDKRTPYDGGEMTPFGYDENPDQRFVFHWKLMP